ncbi:HAD-IIIA family hydrolase [Candidatus Woesearchaeota archaeon]|nr:HAD-IIIA family hydrolase [Candidatus Woesearchaeota archaeon]
MKSKAVFLDRDGVINKVMYHDEKGIYSAMNAKELHFLPKVGKALKTLKQSGFKIIVISNQPGVAFGYIKAKDLEEIDRKILKSLPVDAIYNCIHHPEFTGQCNCRKPKHGLFNESIEKFKIDVRKSYAVGDNLSDLKVDLPFRKRFLIGIKRNDVFNFMHQEKVKAEIVKDLYEAALRIKVEDLKICQKPPVTDGWHDGLKAL